MRRHRRFLSGAWKALAFFVTVRAAARPCRSRRVPPEALEAPSWRLSAQS
ncbi:MAG: hypothetical protein KAG62_17910 [Caulobacter sp.]|nr:hypothetical protein [Caulobacter sp.]